MMASWLWRSIAVLLGLASCGQAFATMILSEKAELGVRDRAYLENHICGEGQKAEQIDAQRVQTKPPTISARITCAPYGTIAGYGALKTGECEKTNVEWSCGQPVPALRMKMHSEDLVLEYADSVTPSAAIDVVKFVSGISTFNGQSVATLLVGRCRISDGRTAPFPGAVNFNYVCAGPSASITKDCWKNQCRLFFTDFGISVP